MSLRLLVAVSAHGFGHFAQVAPVLNRLHRELPGLQLIVRTTLPQARLSTRLEVPFEWQQARDDFGMVQRNALQVDVTSSMAEYRALHARWEERVRQVAAELAACGPDLVFSDVPYLTLAAAKAAGIPAVAMCSLNWLAIFRHYSAGAPQAGPILRQMRQAYNSAELFLRCEPAMPMPELERVQDIGLVSAAATNRREELERAGWLLPHERLVLIAMGGIDHRLPMERWPRFEGLRFIVPQAWNIVRQDCHAIESFAVAFADLLASCDAVITKPGYGTFADAAANGVPVLYVERQDGWPEQEHLVGWLRQHAQCQAVERERLESGNFTSLLQGLLQRGRYPPVPAHGVAQAVSVLRGYLA